MNDDSRPAQAALPSVDRMLRQPALAVAVDMFGRAAATSAVRDILASLRERIPTGNAVPDDATIAGRAAALLEARATPSLRPVFNLTGTVLHTNLGRAPLPEEAIAAMAEVARGASNLEFDVGKGRRGDRDSHVEAALCRLTGAEAATVVNNNAAAVLLVLNTLARRKEVPVSRGELIEIGGAFRIPDIMARAGCKLVEVGTTNRTHRKDFEAALSARTGLVMKVHASNYRIEGFTAEVAERELAAIARVHGVPFVNDLGSGTLVDLSRWGLPHEPTPAEAIAAGADLVTFSGDKLLGGPQAGVVCGRADLVEKVRRNPMKRAMRCDKMTLAALAAVLRLYEDPDRLAQRLPTLRLLTRPQEEIAALAARLVVPLSAALEGRALVETAACSSQIGSGAQPVETLPSAAVVIRPGGGGRGGRALERLASSFRALPVPVVGRMAGGALWFDLRCLEDEAGFVTQLGRLP